LAAIVSRQKVRDVFFVTSSEWLIPRILDPEVWKSKESGTRGHLKKDFYVWLFTFWAMRAFYLTKSVQLYTADRATPELLARVSKFQRNVNLEITLRAMHLGLQEPIVVATLLLQSGRPIDWLTDRWRYTLIYSPCHLYILCTHCISPMIMLIYSVPPALWNNCPKALLADSKLQSRHASSSFWNARGMRGHTSASSMTQMKLWPCRIKQDLVASKQVGDAGY
jgi:hypothetical protein